jgi:hypothetical protein
MSIGTRFAALFAAWLLACIAELRDVIVHAAGAAIEKRRASPQADAELSVPKPVLLPPPPPQGPVSRLANTAMMAAEHWQEQQNRDALFMMEVARKNLRNAAEQPSADDMVMT